MTNSTDTRTAARDRAQSHFKSSDIRADAIRAEIEKERAAVDAKTAKLRALRLAKEAAEKAEAERLAAEKPAKKGGKSPQK
jgi:nucleoid-associated protein YgaU